MQITIKQLRKQLIKVSLVARSLARSALTENNKEL